MIPRDTRLRKKSDAIEVLFISPKNDRGFQNADLVVSPDLGGGNTGMITL